MAHDDRSTASLGARVPLSVRRDVDRTEREAYVRAGRMRSLQFVTQAGMLAATNLTSFEAMLAHDVPAASGRLSAINDVAMGAIAAEIRALMR